MRLAAADFKAFYAQDEQTFRSVRIRESDVRFYCFGLQKRKKKENSYLFLSFPFSRKRIPFISVINASAKWMPAFILKHIVV